MPGAWDERRNDVHKRATFSAGRLPYGLPPMRICDPWPRSQCTCTLPWAFKPHVIGVYICSIPRKAFSGHFLEWVCSRLRKWLFHLLFPLLPRTSSHSQGHSHALLACLWNSLPCLSFPAASPKGVARIWKALVWWGHSARRIPTHLSQARHPWWENYWEVRHFRVADAHYAANMAQMVDAVGIDWYIYVFDSSRNKESCESDRSLLTVHCPLKLASMAWTAHWNE